MKQKLRILNVEDNPNDSELIQTRLEEDGLACEMIRVDTEPDFLSALGRGGIDLLLIDYSLPSFDGLSALAIAQSHYPDIPFIFVSGSIGEDRAIEAVKSGATDYVLKDKLSRLGTSVRRALTEADEKAGRKRAEAALRKSEERLTMAVTASHMGVWEWDLRTNAIFWSPECYEIFGVKDAAVTLGSFTSLLHPDDAARVMAAGEKAIAERNVFREVFRVVRPDNRTVWLSSLGKAEYDAAGSALRLVGTMQDITERKRSEQERELTVEFLRLVNESADTRGLIRAATTFFRQQSGCEAVGVRLRDGEDYPYFEAHGFSPEFVQAENSLCARDSANCVIRDNKVNPVIECMCGNVICGRFDPAKSFFTKQGSFWSNNTTELLRRTTDADRQARTRNRCNGEGFESVALLPLRVGEQRLGLLQLNDRRKEVFSPETIGLWERLADQLAVALAKFQSEEALQQAQARTESVLASVADVHILFDREWRYLYVNKAAVQSIGRPREQILGRTLWELYPDIDGTKLDRQYRRSMDERVPVAFEFYYPTTSTWWENRFFPAPEGLAVFATDITERKRAEEAVLKSEKKYQDLFDSTLDGIFRVDAEGVFILMNPAGAQIFGCENPDEILGRNALEFWRDPEDREAYRAELKIHKKLSAYPMRAKKKNGEPLELESSTRVIEDKNGNFLGLEGILRDVTVRKRAEEELRSSVQMWNNTFDAMNEAISIMDTEGKILRCNKEMLFFFDKTPGQILGKTHWDIMHPAEGRMEVCAFSRMLETHRRESMIIYLQMHCFNVVIDPILDREGKLAGCVQVMTDITEHRRFEEQLRESESKFRSLAEQSLVGTYIIQDGIFRYASPRLADMFAYSVEDIIDRKGPIDLVVPDDHKLVNANMRRRLAGEAPFSHYEARGQKKDGGIIFLEIFGSTTTYQGRPAIIGAVLDITEKKKLESQLRQSQKMEAVGQLTGGIAHDFNNILSAIIGYGYLLKMQMKEDDPHRSYVDHILAGADRAANLTRSLLTFSRKQISNPMPMDVNESIRKVRSLLQRVIGEDIDLRTSLAPAALVVNADEGQIEQVLMNLATNARDAMQKGGILSLDTSIVGAGEAVPGRENDDNQQYALITITDTGVGMDVKIREKIFEPFFTTKDMGRGTGLGLSVVYGIIQQHHGQIHCYSEPMMGTTFKIYLPLLSGHQDAVHPKNKMPAQTEQPGGTETILVVEDDETLRGLAKSTLEDRGYTVITAVDGRDAVERFLENRDRVRLVLCDVIMPRMSGGEVWDAIRKEKPDARVLFMSGYPSDIIQQKNLLDEGAELILKPVSPMALLRKVREVLDRK